MKSLIAFFLGIREFRLTFTTYFHDYSAQIAYDKGRELAHRMTFRRYET